MAAKSTARNFKLPAVAEQPWYQSAAELIAREGLSLREAATRLQIPITSEVAANTFRNKTFQRVLRAERLRYFNEIAGDSAWSKRAAVGQMLYLISRLVERGEDKEALEGLLKVAKVEGWLSADTNVNLLYGLTEKEFQELRAKALAKAQETTVAN